VEHGTGGGRNGSRSYPNERRVVVELVTDAEEATTVLGRRADRNAVNDDVDVEWNGQRRGRG
jgi:hypothetical protein